MDTPSENSPLVLQQSQKNNSLDHQPKARLRKFYSAPIRSLMSSDMDVDSLRMSYAAKLVLAAVEARNVESAVDLIVGLNGGFINPLAYPLYRNLMVCVILVHLALALWEGGPHPLPLNPSVAVLEATIFVFYTADVLLNFWTFGAKQFREKKWHLAFAVLSIVHCLLLIFAMIYALGEVHFTDNEKQIIPRLALLAAHALRPIILISQLKTTRRVFTNVLRNSRMDGLLAVMGEDNDLYFRVTRTIFRTTSFLALWAVLLVFFSVLGRNLFNSLQVSGYDAKGDNFNNFSNAVLALFILSSEENFPMVADPAFSQRPLVAYPFFVSFLLLILVVIMPLLLGIVFDAYAQQHERQLARCRRKARNALLAAYYVLDEDGSMGLTQEQLVAVLTTEASIGINRQQAEQLWRTLVPEEAEHLDINGKQVSHSSSGNNAKVISRSHSLPPVSSLVSSGAAGSTLLSTVQETPGRLVVGSFLRLADLLHEKVVDNSFQEFHDTEGGNDAVYGGVDSGDEIECGRGVSIGSNGDACRIRCIRERLRRFASEAVYRPWFSRTSQFITVILSLLSVTWSPMSQTWHDRCLGEQATTDSCACWRENALRLTEALVLLAFLAEMTIKVLAVGWRTLWRRDWAARFDFVLLVLLMATNFVIVTRGNILAVYVDMHPSLGDLFDLPRSLVILRLLTVFPSLRELLETMATVSAMLGNILVLYACVSYSFAAVGMAIFGDLKSDLLPPRYSFSSLLEAILALFFLTIINNWNDLLYPLVNSVSVGRWSALYFVSYMLFCATLVFDVLVGVVIEGFHVSRRGPDASISGAGSTRSGGMTSDEATINSSSCTNAADEGDATSRKASHRKYKQVKAEDIFRSAPKGELSAEDVQELEESVKAVEERLHQAWVNHLRSLKVPGEDTE